MGFAKNANSKKSFAKIKIKPENMYSLNTGDTVNKNANPPQKKKRTKKT